jgi:hypothetical protein
MDEGWWEVWGRLPGEKDAHLLAKIPDPESDFPHPTPQDEELAKIYVRQLENSGYVQVEARRVG